MKKKLFTLLMTLILLTGSGTWAQAQTKGTHTFRLGDNQFWLDDKPFQIISGEIHPSRIPAEYWKQRIQMIKAMGCNTVACYIMWNYHESEPGVFDFQTGNKNLEKFIQTVQDEGMFLLFRPGPYVCGEWDFGGLPPYLLSIPDIKIRCMDTRYTAAVERYVDKIAPIIKKYEITNGGPIIMVQVENEYGSYGNDRIYMKWMHNLWRDKGIEVPFYTADGATPYMLEAGTLPGVAIGLDPAASKAEFDEALKVHPDASVFCSELYPGWLTHWREEWQHPSIEKITTDVKWLLDNGKSFNYYVIHGGTNFGFWAGANSPQPGTYQPDVTSYDYDAPINEMGQATPKYMALRELTQKYSKKKLAPIPDPIPTITFPATETKRYTSIWDNLPAAKQIVQPVPMEMMKQYEGMILYRTKLIGHKSGKAPCRRGARLRNRLFERTLYRKYRPYPGPAYHRPPGIQCRKSGSGHSGRKHGTHQLCRTDDRPQRYYRPGYPERHDTDELGGIQYTDVIGICIQSERKRYGSSGHVLQNHSATRQSRRLLYRSERLHKRTGLRQRTQPRPLLECRSAVPSVLSGSMVERGYQRNYHL
ncbi:beta-galactosidase [Bacteroides salyersiae]|nr:beta-galactosidase [Bacteroides salyersiae]